MYSRLPPRSWWCLSGQRVVDDFEVGGVDVSLCKDYALFAGFQNHVLGGSFSERFHAPATLRSSLMESCSPVSSSTKSSTHVRNTDAQPVLRPLLVFFTLAFLLTFYFVGAGQKISSTSLSVSKPMARKQRGYGVLFLSGRCRHTSTLLNVGGKLDPRSFETGITRPNTSFGTRWRDGFDGRIQTVSGATGYPYHPLGSVDHKGAFGRHVGNGTPGKRLYMVSNLRVRDSIRARYTVDGYRGGSTNNPKIPARTGFLEW
ncbi:hypothetical protein FQR65_LT20786 [Abscondita terminalis]|nr:hypothetical protein FQR65_LT20786 [Abscondita terminalis]